MPLIGFIAVALLLLQPGFFLVKKIGLEDSHFGLVLAVTLSIGINGTALYYISLLAPLSHSLLWLYAAGVALLFLLTKGFFPLSTPQIRGRWEKLFFALFAALMVAYAVLCLNAVSSFDTLSYHLPAIDRFTENGQLPDFKNPTNGFEASIMAYPFAMHALIGGFNILTGGRVENYFMFLLVLLLALMIYFVGGRAGNKTFLGPVFFFLSPIVLLFGTPILTDMYSALFFLLGTYFLIRALGENSALFALLNGAAFGLMLLGKPVGAFFYAANLAFLAWHRRWAGSAASLGGFLLVSGAYLSRAAAWLPLMSERWGTVGFSAALGAKEYLAGFHTLAASTWQLIGGLYITIVVPFLLAALIVRKRGIGNDFFLKLGLFLFVFYFATAPLNLWFRRFIGFSRFIWPVLIVWSISAAEEAKNLLKGKGIMRHISIVLLAGVLLGHMSYVAIQSARALHGGGKPVASAYYSMREIIPNKAGIKVYNANSDNPIIYGFEKVSIVDTHSFPEPVGGPCEFLKEEKIDYVLFWLPHKISPFLFPHFNKRLLESIEKEECGKVRYKKENWVIVYETSFDEAN
jgi:hypothetical protein